MESTPDTKTTIDADDISRFDVSLGSGGTQTGQ